MAKAKKFGAFGGVFTPSILTLLGVIMYLRLPWIIGQAGLIATLGIILVAHIVSLSTGLSVASIATDKKVETGGTYFIISRSLGLPIGGTLGWALFAGLSLSVSLYLIGFSEVLLSYFGYEVTLDSIRVMGSVVLFAITVLTFISTSLTIKTQYIILTIMILSILSVFLGRHDFGPSEPQITTLPDALPWITLFAIFFPAVTGFEAGVAMSGDLKDARKDIPRGTIMAILVALLVYIGLTFFFSYTVDSNLLVNDPNVLFKTSLVPQLVIAGVLGATLSSALGSILGAPRILQAVAGDRIAPRFLAKGFGPSNEPRNALLFTYLIAQAGILIGELNAIARVVTIFFIITYGFLNITYTVESWASSDFRPSFRIPRIVSIIGAVACIVLMIQLDILALGIAAIVLTSLFLYLKNKELILNSGDTRSSIWLSLVKTGLMRLSKSELKGRNWRPNIIVFSGGVSKRPYMAELGAMLAGKLGIYTNFDLVTPEEENELGGNPMIESTAEVKFESLNETRKVITRRHMCSNVYDGIGVISSVYGFSGFEPNTVLMGWPRKPLNNAPFEKLISNLVNQDYNISFLRYDTDRKFGNHETIDIWWSGSGNVLPLALHLVRFITSTPVWRRARLRILVINNSLKNYERYHGAATELLEDLRIEGEVKIINNVENAPVREIIRAESADTDLIISEILSLDSGNIPSAIAKTNSLVGDIGTAIFLRASSFFETTQVLPFKLPATPASAKEDDDKDVSPILSATLPREEPLTSYVRELTHLMESAAVKFSEGTLDNIREENEILYDQIDAQLEKESARIYALDKIKDRIKRDAERKKILMEFGGYILNLLEDYKITSLKARMKAMDKGIELFLRESLEAVRKFPSQVTIQYDKDDYLRIKPKTFGQKLRRSLVLMRFNIHSRKISFKVRTDNIVYHYMYYKRLRATELFYEHFSSESLSFMPMIRELGKFFKDGNSERYKNEYIPDIMAALTEGRESTREFIERYKVKQYNDIASDINNITAVFQNPHVNILSGRLRSINKGAKDIRERLDEFPSIWEKYIYSHVNRCKLDFIYLTIKERISLSLQRTIGSVETKINSSLIGYFDEFRLVLKRAAETGDVGHMSKSPVMPAFDTLFASLMNDIEDAVNSVEEEVVTGSNTIPEKITITYMDEAPEYTVPLRKLADYHISNKLSNTVSKESYDLIETCRNVIASLKNIHKLASFSFNPVEDEEEDTSNEVVEEKELKRRGMCDSLVASLNSEQDKLIKATEKLSSALRSGLAKAFEPLNAVEITSSHNKLKKIKAENVKGGIVSKVSRGFSFVIAYMSRQFGNLLYKQSEGMIWAGKMDRESGLSFQIKDNFSAMIERATPDKGILELLPFYYLNLFTGRSGAGEDFWIGMEEESVRVRKAVTRFNMGAKGMLIITGERRSGKSSLSRHLANLYFSGGNIFYVRAPRESTSDVSKFDSVLADTILKETYSLNNGYKPGDPLHSLLTSLDGKSVVIVNDLELWWERKPGGTSVVERIIELMQHYGERILFVVNVNEISLNVINSLTSIRTWALDVVTCRPFSAKEIKHFIIDRHRAGGLNFVLEGKEEHDMTTWDYARFFNHIFHLSGGNPGYSINLWLASIKNITGNTIYLERPEGIDSSFKEAIGREDAVFIMQFLLHRRFSPDHLAALLETDISETASRIRDMLQKGILVEKYPGIYSLNGMLVPFLIDRLRSMKLL